MVHSQQLQSFIDYYYSLNLDLEKDVEPIAKRFLSQREFEILAHRIKFKGHNYYTLDKLGKKFGRSKESIRQTEERSIQKIIRELNWENDKKNISDILDMPINYLEIGRCINGKGLDTRIHNALHYYLKIDTYRDFVNFIEKYKSSKYTILRIKNVRDPIRSRNLGVKCLVALYKHLHSIGIELFEDSYSSEELGES